MTLRAGNSFIAMEVSVAYMLKNLNFATNAVTTDSESQHAQ
jgi:hypothetical protein